MLTLMFGADDDQVVQRDLMQKQEISKLKEEVTQKALHIIRNVFPAKVMQLTKQLDTKPFSLELVDVRQPVVLSTDSAMNVDSEAPKSKKRKLDETTSVPTDSKSAAKSNEVVESNKVSTPKSAVECGLTPSRSLENV